MSTLCYVLAAAAGAAGFLVLGAWVFGHWPSSAVEPWIAILALWIAGPILVRLGEAFER